MARFFTNALAGRLVTLIYNASQTGQPLEGLGLRLITQGDLTALPGPQQFASALPAVVVGVQEVRTEGEASGRLHQVYPFPVIYARPFVAGEQPSRELVDDAELLADWLMDQRDLGGLTLDGGAIEDSLVRRIVYQGQTERFFRALQLDVSVAEIHFEVTVTALRR